MFRFVISLIIVAIMFFSFSGCGKVSLPDYQPPQQCINDEGEQKPSLILKYTKYPNETALVLKASVIGITISEKITADKIISFFETVESMINEQDDKITYAELMNYVRSKVLEYNKEAGVVVLILSQYGAIFEDKEIPIYECDRYLLLKHIQEQKMNVMLLKSQQ